jgi:hypothetical protein
MRKEEALLLGRTCRRHANLSVKCELITNGLKIISMKMEYLFLDSVSFLSCALRKLREAFGLEANKSWYPQYFNTKENLDYVGPKLDISY